MKRLLLSLPHPFQHPLIEEVFDAFPTESEQSVMKRITLRPSSVNVPRRTPGPAAVRAQST